MYEHNIFQQSLYAEYLEYKKLSFNDFDRLKDFLERGLDKKIHAFDTSYNGFLDYSYNYYCDILEILKNTTSKKYLLNIEIKRKSHIWIGDFWLQDVFYRMYWVVQDAVYFYLSKLEPQMHQINLMFIDFFKQKQRKEDPFYQPQKEVYNYHLTPSCPQFKYLLLGYDEKYINEIEYSPIFTMFLYPLSLTKFGKDNILEIISTTGKKLEEYAENHNGNSLLRYHFGKYKIRNLNRMLKMKADIIQLEKEAENEYRITKNLPKIGENWIEETRLYNLIKESFPFLTIIQHGKPKFLGKQHYDIWIPKIRTAIEYQGEQHKRPIDYFGGHEAFLIQQERDKRKLKLSIENSVHLIYLESGYDLKEIESQIEMRSQYFS